MSYRHVQTAPGMYVVSAPGVVGVALGVAERDDLGGGFWWYQAAMVLVIVPA